MLVFIASESMAASVRVKDFRSWQAPDHTRLVFELSRRAEHTMHIIKNPDRLVIDIAKAKQPSKKVIGNVDFESPVIGVRYGQHDNRLRLVVDLDSMVQARSFLLEPNDNYGYRLLVDIYTTNNKDNQLVEFKPKLQDRDVVVVIDPGHGGDDPGAIGVAGSREKDVVLRFSKILRDEINRLVGIRAEMTREKDYFIDLRKRNQIARQKHADLFLSVHANSFPESRRVNGFIIFALSSKGATSEMARWLAKSENKSDEIGGADNLALEGKSKNLRKVLIDLSMTSVLNHSILVGKEILHLVGKGFHLHRDNVEQAGFTVLKSPDIPALLLELGFLSNRKEEKLLSNTAYTKRMARAIANGVGRYFNKFPPFGTSLDKKINAANTHTVVAGDTLSQIAKQYKVDIDQLRKLNNVPKDTIIVGQRLKLYTEVDLVGANEAGYYLVKGGDTLSEIAVRLGVPVSRLRNLNNITGNTIFMGQKLKFYE